MHASAFLSLVTLAIAGCGSGTPASPETAPAASPPASSSSEASAEVDLRFDETIDSQGLKLRWLKIEDSRCPIGVTCIWAGQVAVTLEVARGEDGPIEVQLVHAVGNQPEPARAFDRELRLLGVDPHPKSGVTPERGAYVARIEISEPSS